MNGEKKEKTTGVKKMTQEMEQGQGQEKSMVEIIMPDGEHIVVDANNLTEKDVKRIEGGIEKRNKYLVKDGRLHPPHVNKIWYDDEWQDVDHCIMRPHGAGLPLDYYEDTGMTVDGEDNSGYDYENDRYFTNEELGLDEDDYDDEEWRKEEGLGDDDEEEEDFDDDNFDDLDVNDYDGLLP